MRMRTGVAIGVVVTLLLIAGGRALWLRIMQDDIWVDPSNAMSPFPGAGPAGAEYSGFLADSFLEPRNGTGCHESIGDRCDYRLCTGGLFPKRLDEVSYTLAWGLPPSEYPLYRIELTTDDTNDDDPYVEVNISKKPDKDSPFEPIELRCCNEHPETPTCVDVNAPPCSGAGLPIEMYYPHQNGTEIRLAAEDGTIWSETDRKKIPKWRLKHDDDCSYF